MVDSHLLDEQLDYYRERAAEYDEWWERRGRYDRGPEANTQWRTEISQVRAVFDTLPLSGDVLELAPGTGYWTELLAQRARRVTALDGSSEMIAINQARLGKLSRSVDYHQVNLFDWKPTRRWDGLVFCFWISHVPRDRLAGFLAACRDALVEGATMFFLDGQRINESTAVDHVLPGMASEIMVRKLNDGREFRIVKNFHEPVELTELAGAAGFDLEVHRTDNFFHFAVGVAR
ncbi:MAG: methyltransferase domain-containing protein [Actinomycetia bacterium]|nr:methyltransferase domain-containing protein [Actinomycetes bacterium]